MKTTLLEALLQSEKDNTDKQWDGDVAAESAKLKERVSTFLSKESFSVGDLVTWKDGLKNKKNPKCGQPVVVVEILGEPATNQEDNSGSPYYREPLDIVCGRIDSDGEFLLYHYDSRRLTKVE